MVHLSGHLLNGFMLICPNAPLQPSFTSVIYDPWCATFPTSLIFDSAILPCTVYSYHGGTQTNNSEVFPPYTSKLIIVPFRTPDKMLFFYLPPTIAFISNSLGHPLYTPTSMCCHSFSVIGYVTLTSKVDGDFCTTTEIALLPNIFHYYIRIIF